MQSFKTYYEAKLAATQSTLEWINHTINSAYGTDVGTHPCSERLVAFQAVAEMAEDHYANILG